MEKKGTTIKKPYWLIIIFIQTILMAGIAIWAITQKVEAEKQKILAFTAKEEAVKNIHLASIEKDEKAKAKAEIEKQILIAEQAKAEALVYKKLYENSLKRKK